jgi:phage host-nuclease inhibitor protein Gam
MPRRKEKAVIAPSDASEATLMIGAFVAIEREIALERLAAAAAIDRIAAQRDARLADLRAQAQPLFAGLKAWWEAGGKDEIASGRRSAEIAGARIGIRLTTPRVKLRRGVTLGDVVAWLRSLRWVRARDFLRTKIELDRQAVIKAVQAEQDIAEIFAERLTVEQTDEFFIAACLDEDELKKELAA